MLLCVSVMDTGWDHTEEPASYQRQLSEKLFKELQNQNTQLRNELTHTSALSQVITYQLWNWLQNRLQNNWQSHLIYNVELSIPKCISNCLWDRTFPDDHDFIQHIGIAHKEQCELDFLCMWQSCQRKKKSFTTKGRGEALSMDQCSLSTRKILNHPGAMLSDSKLHLKCPHRHAAIRPAGLLWLHGHGL